MKTIVIRVRLALALATFFLLLLVEYAKLVKIPLFALTLLSLMIGLVILNNQASAPQVTKSPQLNSAIITGEVPIENKVFSEKTVLEQIAAYEQLLRLQPTHRDLLINTALLYQAKLDMRRSEYYWLQAQKQDPNLSLFSEQKISLLD